eukprot:TRINITY_DN1007_c0_g1_i2.p1 TRINITY_DN1007_c0_g1~~TRINITY_DN1007_c0_g1_i2.p1  ORF type:complete len:298 (+),score=49.46 TRINITY_DN1007_c0_g1_i2:97-990(+)
MLTKQQFTERFEITNEQLGQGYFAVVRAGIDKSNNTKVAIKCVDKKLVEKVDNLETETSLLQRIDHPHIVRLVVICDTKSTLFIVMELMEGGELYEEIVKRKSFTEKDASYIMRQLFSALDYLHKNGIAHRDLKLENLLLVKRDSLDIKLADFGLSKVFSATDEQKMKTACGTPYYVAPEILTTEGYTNKIDMWAAGVLLYVLLSGRLPFSGDSDVELFQAILESNLVWKKPQFDTVSDDAKDLIQKLITKDVNTRYSAEQSLAHHFIANQAANRSNELATTEFYEELKKTSKRKLK